MASKTLYAPSIPSSLPAFIVTPKGNETCDVSFELSKYNSSSDFKNIQVTVKKQDSGMNALRQTAYNKKTYPYYSTTGILLDVPCDKLIYEDGKYHFTIPNKVLKQLASGSEYKYWVPGYSYKIQIRLSTASYGEYYAEATLERDQFIANLEKQVAANDESKTTNQEKILNNSTFYQRYLDDAEEYFLENSGVSTIKTDMLSDFSTRISSLSLIEVYSQSVGGYSSKDDIVKRDVENLYFSGATQKSTGLTWVKKAVNDKVTKVTESTYKKSATAATVIDDCYSAIATINSLKSSLTGKTSLDDINTITTKINLYKKVVTNCISVLEDIKDALSSTTTQSFKYSKFYTGSNFLVSGSTAFNTITAFIKAVKTYIQDTTVEANATAMSEKETAMLTALTELGTNKAGETDSSLIAYQNAYAYSYVFEQLFRYLRSSTSVNTVMGKAIITQLNTYYTNIVTYLNQISDEIILDLVSIYSSSIEKTAKANIEDADYITAILVIELQRDNPKAKFVTLLQNYITNLEFEEASPPVVYTEYEWLTHNSDYFSEWSTVCVVKATGQMRLQVPNFDQFDSFNEVKNSNKTTDIYVDNLNFAGVFSSAIDASETLYTYQIDLYGWDDDGAEVLWDSSGIVLASEVGADSYIDTLTSAIESGSDEVTASTVLSNAQSVVYNTQVVLPKNNYYRFTFSYETINGATGSWNFDVIYYSSIYQTTKIKVLTVDYIDDTQKNDERFLASKDPYSIHSKIHEGGDSYQWVYDKDKDEYIRYGDTGEYDADSEIPYNNDVIEYTIENGVYHVVTYYSNSYIMRTITNEHDEEAEGRIALMLFSDSNEALSTNVIVRRASSKDNYSTWEDIRIFNFKEETINPTNRTDALTKVFYDYTAESGVYYKYCTQTEDEYGNRSALYEPTNSIPVVRYFDSHFLVGDNGQQLNLKFNNEMTSFKVAVAENKTDTLGGKYPIVTVNGNMRYRTFPITGLISLKMDENQIFLGLKDLYGNGVSQYAEVVAAYQADQGVYGSSQYAYQYEKDFRDKVIDFLMDGKCKLYKSPTEGNIIVRLTDISFKPEQFVDRLLYSFTATAYEMDDFTYENCIKYNFVDKGSCITNFDREEYRVGQLSGTFKTKGFIYEDGSTSAGDDLISLIYEKYNFKGQNIAGHFIKAEDIHGLKISIHHKPMRTDMDTTGFVIEYNGDQIYITTSTEGTYEFDGNVILNTSDTLYILADKEVSAKNNSLEEVDLTVDFIYKVRVGKTKTKQIKVSSQQKGLGQIHDWFEPNESLYTAIYKKYYFDMDKAISGQPQYRRLLTVWGIKIEANPGSVFKIEQDGDDYSLFEVGQTGVLNFYNLVDISKLMYVGWKKNIQGDIDYTKGADVILDYFFYTTTGTYMEDV